MDLVGSAEIQIPELSVSLIDTRGEAIDESLVHITEPEETSTPVPKKKGKTLKSKSAKKANQSVEPSQGATAGPSSPVGRIGALKTAKKVLANSGRASTPEPLANPVTASTPELPSTIDEDIAAITSILLSPIPEGNPVRQAKERIAHHNKALFDSSD